MLRVGVVAPEGHEPSAIRLTGYQGLSYVYIMHIMILNAINMHHIIVSHVEAISDPSLT